MENLLRWLKSCPLCQSLMGPIDGLCKNCFDRILRRASRDLICVQNRPFICLSLLTWDEARPEVGTLIRALKGPWSQRAYRRLAREIVSRQGLSSKNTLLVYPPSKTGKPDHAWWLAREISALTGLNFVSPFHFIELKEQKMLSKREREKRRYLFDGPAQSLSETEGFIFVDDLITTGSTAKAIWSAMGKPKSFCSWSVACRPLQKLL